MRRDDGDATHCEFRSAFCIALISSFLVSTKSVTSICCCCCDVGAVLADDAKDRYGVQFGLEKEDERAVADAFMERSSRRRSNKMLRFYIC